MTEWQLANDMSRIREQAKLLGQSLRTDGKSILYVQAINFECIKREWPEAICTSLYINVILNSMHWYIHYSKLHWWKLSSKHQVWRALFRSMYNWVVWTYWWCTWWLILCESTLTCVEFYFVENWMMLSLAYLIVIDQIPLIAAAAVGHGDEELIGCVCYITCGLTHIVYVWLFVLKPLKVLYLHVICIIKQSHLAQFLFSLRLFIPR